jgi:periplasmic protein TonB
MKTLKKSISLFFSIVIFLTMSIWIACNSDSNSNSVSNANVDTSTRISSAPDSTKTNKSTKSNKGIASVTKSAASSNGNMRMDKNGIYNRAEVMPSFPGGETALDAYIQNNIEYPTNALNNDIQGPVLIQFAVDTNGKVFQTSELNKKLGYGLDEEAMRIVSAMPDWSAGTIHGKKVRTYCEIPIAFAIQSENEGIH